MYFKILKWLGYLIMIMAVCIAAILFLVSHDPEVLQKLSYDMLILGLIGCALVYFSLFGQRFPQFHSHIERIATISLLIISLLLIKPDGEVIASVISAIVTALTFVIGLYFNTRIINESNQNRHAKDILMNSLKWERFIHDHLWLLPDQILQDVLDIRQMLHSIDLKLHDPASAQTNEMSEELKNDLHSLHEKIGLLFLHIRSDLQIPTSEASVSVLTRQASDRSKGV
ncbi:hypothetical protein [Thermoactinomyces sp. CICC 10522]|jgi:hypothetical protein|uniref:hypothetical protein n=1 Tax=Thermoactinomyces sp. CICC 10522 TaxID=2767427 RepID=UPI0018DD47A1|nr:hypothetical protein [Thermoactinomyces sp. CICC 10522]MBH8603849.1 hypothetical protein [Thermoactinomyces sp. CICC 10522]